MKILRLLCDQSFVMVPNDYKIFVSINTRDEFCCNILKLCPILSFSGFPFSYKFYFRLYLYFVSNLALKLLITGKKSASDLAVRIKEMVLLSLDLAKVDSHIYWHGGALKIKGIIFMGLMSVW